MEQFELNDINKRIGLDTNLDNISKEICKYYRLGEFLSNELITIGYEDYNYYLTTSKGKYCVKIFNNERTKEDIENYLDRIRIISNSEVSTPKPLLSQGDILYSLDYLNNHYDICVFEYINGNNFFELKGNASEKEIKELAKQTALINNLDVKLDFIYDSWAIINFKYEYNKKKEYLSKDYQDELDKLIIEFDSIDFELLPYGFVHGDIISTNVMKDLNSKIWIIDFAVSNYLPRIIDLAVLACNMCLDKNSKTNTFKNIDILLEEYNKYNELTEYELSQFKLFYKLANAMHILCPTYIAKTEGSSEENDYWLNEGILGYSFAKEYNCNLIKEKRR